jgi:hypothetical protein
MTDDNDVYTAAQAREYASGYLRRKPRDIWPHAGVVETPQVRRALSVLEAHYSPERAEPDEPMPARLEDTKLARMVVRNEGTETFSRALEHGDMATAKYFTGDSNQRADISGMQAISKLKSMVAKPATLIYIWAPPGSGKTDFSLLLAQLWSQAHPNGQVASNIRTLKDSDEWIHRFGHLKEWMREDEQAVLEGGGRRKLMVFDEASSHASGRGKVGAEAAAKLGPMVYKIRKFGGSLIIIGHDGRDVHPMVREMATCINKTDLKTASVFESVKNRKGEGHIMDLEGIPPTDWRYNDKEATSWSWSEYATDEDEQEDGASPRDLAIYTAIKAKKSGLTNRETAKFVPYSRTWVGSRFREYNEDGEHHEILARIEGEIA